MTFVEFIEYFRLWGPLGIWAGLTTWGCVHLYRAVRASGMALVDATKSHGEAVQRITEAAAKKVEELASKHAEEIAELNKEWFEIHEKGATENRELTKQVRELIEVVSRKQRGR